MLHPLPLSQLFAADAPLPTSPGQQLLDLPPTDYNGLAFSADKDHRLQKTPGRENNFDADAVLERYYRSGAGPPEGDMSSVAGPSSSGGPGAAGPSAGTDVKAKTVKLSQSPGHPQTHVSKPSPNALYLGFCQLSSRLRPSGSKPTTKRTNRSLSRATPCSSRTRPPASRRTSPCVSLYAERPRQP
jgi:hypothetical protein